MTNRFPVLEAFPSCVMPVEMLSDRPDRIRAAVRVLGSPMRSYPDSKLVEEAFEHLELLVVCDIAWTEDCELADYVLPAKSHFERYEFNAFQMNFPECVMTLRPPIFEETIAERRDMCEVLLDISKKCRRAAEAAEVALCRRREGRRRPATACRTSSRCWPTSAARA